NALAFDARAALHAILGVDLTRINGLGPYLALKLVGECGTNLTAWPSAKHFTSWLASHLTIRFPAARCCRRRRGAQAIARHPCYALPRVPWGEPIPRSVHSTGGCRPGSGRQKPSPRPLARSRCCSTTRCGMA